jgi:hypothetical protein
MELAVIEDILVYSILIGILVYAFFTLYPRTQVEGFAAAGAPITATKTRIEAELTEVRKKSPTFFTQTASSPTLPTNQSFLVNICPLTGYLGGYLGPPEKLMNAQLYLELAIKAGIRSFVLPISTYINKSKEPPEWPFSGEPAIVCRDSADIIISENGLSIDAFVNALVQNKSISGFGSEPIFLWLEDTISDIDRKKINYVNFMKQIAKSLSPLDSFRLTTVGSYGSVVGGQQQKALLTQIPLSAFTNKVIILTNFDTAQDKDLTLASYANFLYSSDTTLPVRTVGMEDLPGTSVDFRTNARINWYTVTSKTPLAPPSSAGVKAALDNGLQCIPVPFLSVPMSDIKDIWSLWNGASYKLKPEAARYTQPNPVVPSKVSTKLNASIQGKEPGNLVVN